MYPTKNYITWWGKINFFVTFVVTSSPVGLTFCATLWFVSPGILPFFTSVMIITTNSIIQIIANKARWNIKMKITAFRWSNKVNVFGFGLVDKDCSTQWSTFWFRKLSKISVATKICGPSTHLLMNDPEWSRLCNSLLSMDNF